MLPFVNRKTIAMHWGIYHPVYQNEKLVSFESHIHDSNPSALINNVIDARTANARILRPAIRRSFLAGYEKGKTAGRGNELRGRDSFIELDWDEALDIASCELQRIRNSYGNQSIYGGSYGWASAGRFHHAQSQIHRFLNSAGGYYRSIQNYSYAAADIILPHIVGTTDGMAHNHTPWERIIRFSRTIVMFGGVPEKNAQVSSGGVGKHILDQQLKEAHKRGIKIYSISPVRDDTAGYDNVVWVPLRPATDVALMLGIMHELVSQKRVNVEFLNNYTVGSDVLLDYVRGMPDQIEKSPEWASAICDVPAALIRELAHQLADTPSFIMMAWALQRAEHGEQPYWMAIALASLLGQIGLPGRGIGFGYGSMNGTGNAIHPIKWPSLPQGENAVRDFIPVARIADALLNPGQKYDFNGKVRQYPLLKMIYWAGGNPFHHHQDLNKLRKAWAQPETIICHESWWTATAKHSDIVFPVTMSLERDDIAASARENFITASHRVCDPYGESRDDYEIFSGLAERLGFKEAFTQGRDTEAWLRFLYAQAIASSREFNVNLPDFESFWKQGMFLLPSPPVEQQTDLLAKFREDPSAHPSGKIEIFSNTIAGFNYPDCPGHPSWLEPQEYLLALTSESFPLHLLSNQPKTRLHSQHDLGTLSMGAKCMGREVMRMNPIDALARGLKNSDIVKVYNNRGSCLAAVMITDDVREGVVQLPTGAWYDPQFEQDGATFDRHGNPNVLTADKGTSRLSQGPAAQSCLVEVARFDGIVPEINAFSPPIIL